jgi:isopenicillin-N N-acyltransferase-like protein
MLPVIEAFEPAYLEEMAGIAEGAQCTLEEIVTINCRTEMVYGHDRLAAASDNLEEGCTGFVVMPEAARGGRLMHCHNWDWRAECVDTAIILRIARDDGPNVLTFTEAGGLARHGINGAGISLSGNYLSSEREYVASGGVPLVLIRRRMLESTHLAGAMRAVWNTTRFCSNNVLVAQSTMTGDGEAFDLECAPDEIFWIEPRDGTLVHCNHWLAPSARAKLIDRTLLTETDSLYRQRRVEAALSRAHRAGHPIDWTEAKTILADRFGEPDSVLCFPKPASHDNVCVTVATTLMDPAAGTMWVAKRPWLGQDFREYRL